MFDVKKILIKHGYNGDLIEKLSRWEKIDLLRELSNKLGKDVENYDDVSFSTIYRNLERNSEVCSEFKRNDKNAKREILKGH